MRSELRQVVGAAHPRDASLSASAFPWAKGSSEFVWAGDRIVAFHPVEEDLDASDNAFVFDRFNGCGSQTVLHNHHCQKQECCIAVRMPGQGISAASESSPGHDRRY